MQRFFLHYHGSISKFLPWWSSYRTFFPCVSPALLKVTTCGRAKPNRLSLFSASSTSSVSPPPKWRVLFFGTDDFALETLKLLHAELSRRDEKSGGGSCVAELEVVCPRLRTLVPAVARYAAAERLRLHTWPLAPEALPAGKFDVGVVASFGHLIPGRVIGAFPRGILNVHGSLLPRWRGAAPIIHALRAGATETGLTVMKIRPGRFDVGDIVATETVAVGGDERRPELTRRMAEVGARLLVAVLRDLERYEAESRPQPLEGISHAPAVDKSLAFIDFSTQGRY
jgi:methionyl-tRNA formyltransferase